VTAAGLGGKAEAASHAPHESPPVMTIPLVVLAVFAVGLGFLGTPLWPWFQGYLTGEVAELHAGALLSAEHGPLMLFSALVVFTGMGVGWRWYGVRPAKRAEALDVIEQFHPTLFRVLREKYYVDELYAATVVRWHAGWAWLCDALDRWVWGGVVFALSSLMVGLSWVSRSVDEYVVNTGFDEACRRLTRGGWFSSRFQGGQVQDYLRALGLALAWLLLVLIWVAS
jgi:NADH-quinone oxidoreductase subunit L